MGYAGLLFDFLKTPEPHMVGYTHPTIVNDEFFNTQFLVELSRLDRGRDA